MGNLMVLGKLQPFSYYGLGCGPITEITNALRSILGNYVVSTVINGVSPTCYRLIHGSNYIILTHDREPIEDEKHYWFRDRVYQILKEVATTFNDLQRHVILQMDKVHIRSDASYKGGRVNGSIDNPDDPYTSFFP